MSSTTVDPTTTELSGPRLRRGIPATLTATAFCVLAGAWSLTGVAATYLPALLVPSALGLPFAVPALRIDPLGGTTLGFWLVDLVAALIFLTVIATRLAHPVPGRGSAFRAGLIATILGLLAANLLRSVHLSFVTHVGLGGYAAVLAGGALVALLWGALVGLVVGLVHALSVR